MLSPSCPRPRTLERYTHSAHFGQRVQHDAVVGRRSKRVQHKLGSVLLAVPDLDPLVHTHPCGA